MCQNRWETWTAGSPTDSSTSGIFYSHATRVRGPIPDVPKSVGDLHKLRSRLGVRGRMPWSGRSACCPIGGQRRGAGHPSRATKPRPNAPGHHRCAPRVRSLTHSRRPTFATRRVAGGNRANTPGDAVTLARSPGRLGLVRPRRTSGRRSGPTLESTDSSNRPWSVVSMPPRRLAASRGCERCWRCGWPPAGCC